jgi:hypothetical protein
MSKIKMTFAAAGMIASLFATAEPARAQDPFAVIGAIAGAAAVAANPYYYGGRQYCFYDGGWSGPGWYWCGYGDRYGYGYGGAPGWQGWSRGGPRAGFRDRDFDRRRGPGFQGDRGPRRQFDGDRGPQRQFNGGGGNRGPQRQIGGGNGGGQRGPAPRVVSPNQGGGGGNGGGGGGGQRGNGINR